MYEKWMRKSIMKSFAFCTNRTARDDCWNQFSGENFTMNFIYNDAPPKLFLTSNVQKRYKISHSQLFRMKASQEEIQRNLLDQEQDPTRGFFRVNPTF